MIGSSSKVRIPIQLAVLANSDGYMLYLISQSQRRTSCAHDCSLIHMSNTKIPISTILYRCSDSYIHRATESPSPPSQGTTLHQITHVSLSK